MGKGVVIFVLLFYDVISFWEVNIITWKVAESVTRVVSCQNKVCATLCSFTVNQEN